MVDHRELLKKYMKAMKGLSITMVTVFCFGAGLYALYTKNQYKPNVILACVFFCTVIILTALGDWD